LARANAQERAAFLHEACAGQPELRSAVEALLAAHEASGDFLNRPPEGLDTIVDSDPRPVDPEATYATGEIIPSPTLHPTCLVGDASPSVLQALGRKLGDVPRVVLRDEAAGEVDPMALWPSGEMAAAKGESRYQLHGEIARGGMGAVLKGRDTDLGRDLAIKVLLDSHKDKPDVVRRFIEEAQIGGQLQHPGIVPVYELGQFADERPFFSMKLVKGQTLSSLLAARRDPAEDRARFLGIFQQICQTLAYAHSRGVIHRDLKPANIMVGAFGEVQVMDWGLAKVLTPAGASAAPPAHPDERDDDVIRTVRQGASESSVDDDSHTQAGSVMGTPAYMAPEQALGEINRLDERADVFGLGAILCEILTGQPPYTDKDTTEVFRLARRGQLDDCHARLEACGVDPDLVELARDCLAAEPDERPRNAGVVADRISAYLASVESRLRAVEIERATEAARAEEALLTVAEAQAKARAERRARRWQLGLAVVVVTVTTVAGLAAAWAAMYQSLLKQDALIAQRQAIAAHAAESKQRQRAEAEKTRADITLADMQTARGLLAGERGTPAEAALWFATASAQAAVAGDSRRQEYNRLRARNWMRQATVPVAVLLLGDYSQQMGFQPGGDLLLVHSGAGHVVLWSWREGKILTWTEPLTGIGAACFSPDGASLALGYASGEVRIRGVPDGKLVSTIRHVGWITALAFSPDGRFLAIGSRSARVWDLGRQVVLDPIWQLPGQITALAFNRRGDRLITACDDKRARVFAVGNRPERPEPLFAPVVHAPYEASPPALIDDDRTLVTVASDFDLACWDLTTGKPISGPIRSRASGLQRVVASPDGRWFATGGYYGPELHAAEAGLPALHLGHTNLVKNLVFDRDSTMLLSVSLDRTARLWSLSDGRPIGPPLPHMGEVNQCAISDGASLVATAQGDGLIRVWRRPAEDLVVARAGNWGQRPRISFDGKLVAPGLWHEAPARHAHQGFDRLRVLAAADGKPAGPDVALSGFLFDSCVGGDNRTVAAVFSRGRTGLLGAWEIASARPVFEPVTLPGLPVSVAARPSGAQLAVLCSTGDLLIFDSRTGKTVLSLRHEGWRNDDPRRARVRYTPDGKALISLGDGGDSTVNVRDADTGHLRFEPLGPVLQKGSVCRGFALSADSRLMATIVNGKNAAQVWDLATGHALAQPLPHPGDHYGLYSVCFSPDARYLLTGNKDGFVRYWDWPAGKLACPPMAHPDEVYDVAITPDGRFAMTTVRGWSQLQVWELTTGRRIAPPVRLPSSSGESSQTLALTPDGRRAFLGLNYNELVVIDLEACLSPASIPVADWALLAELATAQHIEAGDLSGLTKEQWQERWNSLREQNPRLVSSYVTESKSPGTAYLQIQQAAARGDGFARRGQWSLAAKEALAEVAYYPEDRLIWSKAAPRLILAGDIEGYRQLCRRMVEQFQGTTLPEEAESLCKLCSLLPETVDRSQLPVRLVTDALEKGQVPEWFPGWAYGCLALVAYRDGEFAQAVRWSEKSFDSNHKASPGGALALVALAMAQHRLHQADRARQALAEATALIPHDLATLGSPEFHGSLPVDGGIVGHDWLIAEILRREAARLIHKDAGRSYRAFDVKSLLGDARLGQKKHAEAEPPLLAGYEE
jgi:WD40 repeat protein